MRPTLIAGAGAILAVAAVIYMASPVLDVAPDPAGGVRHSIPLDQIRDGGPPPDGIPSIDSPVFGDGAGASLPDGEIVIGLEIGGDARAYPLSILVWHEIVNDVVGGVPVAVTYCPLCYTSQVFDRRIGGEAAEFGTSGKLYNSNLLMYDRPTGSYWSQALGEAVRGELTGERLEPVPFDLARWGDWRELYPGTRLLTEDTGHVRAYGADPYGSYYTDGRILFPVSNEDDRLGPKEVVMGLLLAGQQKAYRQSDIEAGPVNDVVGGTPVLLVSAYEHNSRGFERTVGGEALDFELDGAVLRDLQTGSTWDYGGLAVSGELEGERLVRLPLHPGFWFEWAAFYPGTQLYGGA
ncbi:MAG: DUF3179 domain-containing protein [Nitrosopumilus sp.]|nr:DUF3179 domain-containing protein [Nitrosopumilus sp.]CAI9832509.1 conserved hypothetical protein [Nitrosopumilaceae archaeon]MDA7944808.1 DUF3179 domain-containing protein [Nitrosopumilus sp.]MDA7952951.1 DUF3179 domain-containing protein [Nitrosopumilus sp.]MDA7954620.1 DUF3179 domain-containing protein [Nitrosopumilus sp.]